MATISLTRLAAVTDPFSSLKLTSGFVLSSSSLQLNWSLTDFLFSLIECLVCCWIYGSMWLIPPFFGWNRFVFEGFGTSCTFDYHSTRTRDRLFTLMMLLGGFLLPLVIIILSYAYILKILFRRSRHLTRLNIRQESSSAQCSQLYVYYFPPTRSISAERTRSSTTVAHSVDDHFLVSNTHQTEARATRNALLICAIFCLAWGPYASLTMLIQFGFAHSSNPYVSGLLSLLTKTAACINPLIYALSSSGFRKRARLNRRAFGNYLLATFHRCSWSRLIIYISTLWFYASSVTVVNKFNLQLPKISEPWDGLSPFLDVAQ